MTYHDNDHTGLHIVVLYLALLAAFLGIGVLAAEQSDTNDRIEHIQVTHSIPGPRGPQGLPGPQGDQGIPGHPGTDGQDAPPPTAYTCTQTTTDPPTWTCTP